MLATASTAAGPAAPLIRPETLTPSQLSLAHQAIHPTGNVFLTGAAGVGKSYLLLYVIEQLKLKHPGVGAVAVTAPTGIAALHIQGQTIHSFAGIGLGRNNKETLYQKLSAASRARWAACEVLVIDEISMLDSTLFDKLDFIARGCKSFDRQHLPFGGIKLVLSGDFFQLPPVGLGKFGSHFSFDSLAWAGAKVTTLLLTEIVRQSDPAFMTLLNEVRVGVCSVQTTALLAACHVSRKPVPKDGIVPTKLYCTNQDVDGENATQLAALPGTLYTLPATDVWQTEPSGGDRQPVLGLMDKKCPAVLSLKVGAQVMLSRNMPEYGLVNGSRGVVVGFAVETAKDTSVLDSKTLSLQSDIAYTFPLVRFDNGCQLKMRHQVVWVKGPGGEGALNRIQYPLKLAWALTVHKSQGMTLSRAQVELGNAFDYGQVGEEF